MPDRSSRFGRQTRSPRRKTSWQIGVTSAGTQSLTSVVKQLVTFGVAVAVDGTTLIRTRGEWLVLMVDAAASQNSMSGAMGIGVVTADAFAAGIASIPGPLSDLDWDGWLWHQFFDLIAGSPMDGTVADDRSSINSTSAAARYVIDSKAMRKLEENMVIFGMIETGAEEGTVTLMSLVNSRSLVKLA